MNTTSKPAALARRAGDSVAIALEAIDEGSEIAASVPARAAIPPGFKVAVEAISAGDPVIKHGRTIGWASAPIPAGSLVHTGNLAADRQAPSERHAPQALSAIPAAHRGRFMGFRREDGRVGTRNIIAVVIVSNCAATAARQAADFFDETELRAYPNVDAVVPFIHAIGCGMEMTGEPMDLLRRTLSGYIRNPNVYGAVVLALGCERNNLGVFLEQEKLEVGDRLRTVTLQEIGGVAKAVRQARAYISEMLPEANKCRREPVSAEHLVVGLQTSDSDGLSCLTMNPVMGRVCDLIVAQGGTVLLSETPELRPGAAALRDRAAPAERAALDAILEEWAERGRGRDTALSGRLPQAATGSGLTTSLERGADALAKSGTAPLAAVRRYGEPLGDARGLVFMDSPDADAVSITGQTATGATLILMGTATGPVAGSMPAPTVKLASSSALFARKSAGLDIDCGPALAGPEAVEELAQSTLATLLAVASGFETKSEYETMRETEFLPWFVGVLA